MQGQPRPLWSDVVKERKKNTAHQLKPSRPIATSKSTLTPTLPALDELRQQWSKLDAAGRKIFKDLIKIGEETPQTDEEKAILQNCVLKEGGQVIVVDFKSSPEVWLHVTPEDNGTISYRLIKRVVIGRSKSSMTYTYECVRSADAVCDSNALSCHIREISADLLKQRKQAKG